MDFTKNYANTQSILRLLERMYGDRPKRIKDDTKWLLLCRAYEEQFYQKYKMQINNVYKHIQESIKYDE